MIVRAFGIEGNQRYSWIKNQRSLFVNRTRPGTLRRRTIKLMWERRILGFKPALRIEWRSQGGHYETKQRDHGALTLGDSFG
jgi:hypothetical protein